ncbi:MAG: ATP-binding protein [Solirubrobacteraceae bacterium]
MNTRRFSIEDTSVSEARQFIRQTLSGTPQDQLEMIELMVSELATNCIRHAQTGFRVTIYRNTTEVRVEVTDHAAGEPVVRSPGPADPTGRGLRIVQMLSNSWGVEQKEKLNKTVWFTLSARPAADIPPTSTPRSQTVTTPGSKNPSGTRKLDQRDPSGPRNGLDASTHTRGLSRRPILAACSRTRSLSRMYAATGKPSLLRDYARAALRATASATCRWISDTGGQTIAAGRRS